MHECLFIRKTNAFFTRVDSRIILWIEASGGCSKIVTTEGNYLVNSTLSQLEEILPTAHFCRVNRSCVIGMEHVSGFTPETVLILDREMPLGKAYAAVFFESVKVVF